MLRTDAPQALLYCLKHIQITKVWEFFLVYLRIFSPKFMNFIIFHSEKNFIISGVCLSGVCIFRCLSFRRLSWHQNFHQKLCLHKLLFNLDQRLPLICHATVMFRGTHCTLCKTVYTVYTVRYSPVSKNKYLNVRDLQKHWEKFY